MESNRSIHLRPRLSVAADMLRASDTVADIGCDHGRLSCALIQRGAARRCIAVDVSVQSLEKARALAALLGVDDRVETRLGDGLSPLAPREADAVALLGMGGTLMTRLLERCDLPFNGAKRAVFQPMRAADDIRRYLFEKGCPVYEDCVVSDGGRLYQIFCAGAPSDCGIELPAGWPDDCFLLGYTAFAHGDPLTRTLAEQMLARREKRLDRGGGDLLAREAQQLRQILRNWPRVVTA